MIWTIVNDCLYLLAVRQILDPQVEADVSTSCSERDFMNEFYFNKEPQPIMDQSYCLEITG